MAKVIFDISISLDGFVTASNVRPEEPLGEGGQRLHEWAFGEDERNRELLTEAVDAVGAIIAGRGTYDLSVRGGERMARRALLGFRCSSSPMPSRRMHPREECTPS